MVQKVLTPEQIFSYPGERFHVEHDPTFNYLRFITHEPGVVFDDEARGLVKRSALPDSRKEVMVSMLDVAHEGMLTLSDIERAYKESHAIPAWVMVRLIHGEVTGKQDALIGDGRWNLFWIPKPLVVFHKHDEWCVQSANHKTFDRFDRVFFG